MQRQTRSWPARWLAPLMLVALLAACGGGFRELINPPGASVQQLRTAAQGPWTVTLRLQNFSNVRTRLAKIDLELSVGSVSAGRLQRSEGPVVEADSVELLQFELVPSEAARAAVSAKSVNDLGIPYRLEGRIVTSEPSGDYPLLHDSRLAPVPGRPGEFR